MPKTKATPSDLAAEDFSEPTGPGDDTHAHLAPVEPPQFEAATDDPSHPLHHHAKRDALVSPEPAKE